MMRFFLIGYGYWGKKLFPILQKFGEVIVVDSSPVVSAGRLVIQKNLDENLNNFTITHVFIATPEETHYELVKKCLTAGKHVFVEKPLALTEVQARELIDLATQSTKCVFVDYTFMYDPAVKKIREVLSADQLGEQKKITSVRKSAGFFKPKITVFDDLAPHDIYLLPFLLDTSISGVKGMPISIEKGVIARGTVEYRFNNHLKAVAEYAWTTDESERSLVIEGQHGKLVWKREAAGDTLMVFSTHGGESITPVEKTISPLQLSIEEFLRLCSESEKENNISRYQRYIADVAVLESIRDANFPL